MASNTADTSNTSLNSQRNDRINLAIIGGGISGLSLALSLLKHAPHIHFHIYEAASQFQEIGAGVAIGINAQRALRKIDSRVGEAYDRLRTTNADSNFGEGEKETYLRVVMGMDHQSEGGPKAGEEVVEVFCEGGFSSVHRARFLDAMASLLPKGVQEGCVTFGARLVSIEDLNTTNSPGSDTGVTLLFANGATATADAVIASDGIKSRVRHLLLGKSSDPVFTGKYAYRGLIPMNRAIAALGPRSARNAHHRIGYDGHVLTFPIDKGKTMNVVAFRTQTDGNICWEGEWIQSASREDMHADFLGWSDEVHAILDMMERCDKWALFDHSPAETYHSGGRGCLIGDAAHASTPHQGAGAGMAIEDAVLLCGLLSEVREKGELENVFRAFEAVRKERTQRLVESSQEQAALYDLQASGIGDDIEKITEILPKRWDWIWDYDIDLALEDAKKYMQKNPPPR